MKKLKTKWFKKWAKKKLTDSELLDAIEDLEDEKSTSNLGHNLYKVRIAKKNSGKSGGYRTIVVYKSNDMAIFIYGFGKKEKGNILKSELEYLKKYADDLINLNRKELKSELSKKELFNLEND